MDLPEPRSAALAPGSAAALNWASLWLEGTPVTHTKKTKNCFYFLFLRKIFRFSTIFPVFTGPHTHTCLIFFVPKMKVTRRRQLTRYDWSGNLLSLNIFRAVNRSGFNGTPPPHPPHPPPPPLWTGAYWPSIEWPSNIFAKVSRRFPPTFRPKAKKVLERPLHTHSFNILAPASFSSGSASSNSGYLFGLCGCLNPRRYGQFFNPSTHIYTFPRLERTE